MGSPSDNVAKIKVAYRQWHESKGSSVKAWLDLMIDDVKCYSLAGGAPGAEFTGENVAVRGSTAWRNRKTGRAVDTPKADFWTFRDGKVVEFHEFYDTAALIAAATP